MSPARPVRLLLDLTPSVCVRAYIMYICACFLFFNGFVHTPNVDIISLTRLKLS